MQVAQLDRGVPSGSLGGRSKPHRGVLTLIVNCDFYRGLSNASLWMLLGWSDTRLRYRRSVLGPFWITLSMAVLIVVLGVIYSQIFHTDIRTYLPYLALGFIVWGFISSSINESCLAFQESERIIKQVGLPLSVFVFRVVWRNFIVLLHTIILVIPIWLIFRIVPNSFSLLALPGVALVFLNQCWLGVVLAVISARYRDVPPIVTTVLQITIFATPIMWTVSSLGDNSFIAYGNPVYHFIEIVRGPLSGELPSPLSWAVTVTTVVVGTVFAAFFLERKRHRIVYWL
jgi:ABC-type polysaccharide/polyol phosphate export permease